MKKSLLILTLMLFLTGCSFSFKGDDMTNIRINTGIYPIEYMTKYLYGDYATINSIYPMDTDYNEYKLNKKQITDYSKVDLMIFDGMLPEKDYALAMLNENSKLKLIDATYKLNYTNDQDELWLNPANAIMVAKNIANGLNEYISNPYLKKDVNAQFSKFKTTLTEMDAEYKLMLDNSQGRTLIIGDNSFLFFRKYGFNVISLEEGKNFSEKALLEAEALIKDNKVKYVFLTEGINNETVNNLKNKYNNFEILNLDPINSLSEKDQINKDTYLTMMQANQDLIKKELYR